jgi:serine/threonine protein kinase
LISNSESPIRGEHQGEYEENWVAYRRKFQNAVPGIQQLDIHSSKSTKVIIRREGLKNAYLLHEEIGRGEYGKVHKATDFSTGDLFIAKEFVAKRSNWYDKAKSEIGVIQELTHVSIFPLFEDIGQQYS